MEGISDLGLQAGLAASNEAIIANSPLPTVAFNHPAMKTTAELLARYGNPVLNPKGFIFKWIILWTVPDDIHAAIPCLPFHFQINRDIQVPLEKTFRDLIAAKLHTEIKTYDGCFVIRNQRGSNSISRHAWGIAIDQNAAQNPLYGKVTWSDAFLNVWRNNKWICGADFHSRKDGMHIEWDAATAF